MGSIALFASAMLHLLALLCLPVRAEDDPTWYAGRVVAQVELFAGGGTLPDEDLEPLLRARQGEPLNPAVMQLDLRTLYRVAPLAAVEAEVVPWPAYDPRIGETVEGVKVRYVVYPATRIGTLHIQGLQKVSARQVATASRLSEGEVFEPEHDVGPVIERVRGWLLGEGFPEATVEVEAWPMDGGDPYELEVWIRISEGKPRLLSKLTLEGVPPEMGDRRARAVVRRAGLTTGLPLADAALGRARLSLRQDLARVGPQREANPLLGPRFRAFLRELRLFRPVGGGWVDARIEVEVAEGEEGQEVLLRVIPGQRLMLEVTGANGPLPAAIRAAVREALGLDARLRITRGYLEEAPESVERALAERGYLDASATVALDNLPNARVLRVQVDPGLRYRRGSVQFEGNEALQDAQLRTVLNQASVDVLRRRRLTPQALAGGLEAATQLYRSMGYESARLIAGEPATGRRWPGLSPDRSRRWVDVAVRVEEGPVTTLSQVTAVGVVAVGANDLADVLASLAGKPYSPQGLQALAQRLVDIHRQEGWLDAEVRVRAYPDGERRVSATLEVRPGDAVLLRSFATRGNRRVSSKFLRRNVAPDVGVPVTSSLLDDTRQRLYDLGMFSSLELALVGDDQARDLVVDLRERARHTLEGGLGLASDQGIRALGRWTMRNLFGPADRLDTNGLLGIRFATGGGLLPILRTPEYRIGSTYSTPLSRSSDFTLDLAGLEQIQERSWRLLRRLVGVSWSWRAARPTRLQATARLEHRRLADVDPGTLLPNDVWGADALALPPDPSLETRGRLVDTLELVLLDDRRDNPLQPTRGALFQARVAWSPNLIQPSYAKDLRVPTLAIEGRSAGAMALGSTSLRASIEAGYQRVIPLGQTPTWTLDGEAVGPAIPVDQRYRLGGTASLRGFRRQGVGPLQQSRQLDLDWPDAIRGAVAYGLLEDDTRWVATGGDAFGRASVDWLVPLPVLGLADWDGYDLSLFADVGQVWLVGGSGTAGIQPGPALRVGTGVGMRVLTPVGPLQADLALNPQAAFARGALGERLRHNWREPPLRLHLSLGTLF